MKTIIIFTMLSVWFVFNNKHINATGFEDFLRLRSKSATLNEGGIIFNNMKLKICTKCKIKKPLNSFYRNKKAKDGHLTVCKNCSYYINKVSYMLQQQEYNKKNVEHRRKYKKKYAVEYREKNRALVNQRMRVYTQNNINYRLTSNLRTRLRGAIRGSKSSIMELLDCSIDFLKFHLENKFVKNMTWNNYGKFGWHIDHIKPCSLFDLTKLEERKKCFHYTNLQPLWAKDNWSKGKKYKE